MELFPYCLLALLESLVRSGSEQFLPLGVGDGLALTAKRENGQHLVGFAGVKGELNAIFRSRLGESCRGEPEKTAQDAKGEPARVHNVTVVIRRAKLVLVSEGLQIRRSTTIRL